jgi:Domain of unknown function (DUF3597)
MIIFPLIVRAIRALICNDPPPPPPVKPFPTEAEIDAKLSAIAESRGLTQLNFKTSITDLLVLLEIPNMFHARGLLFNELGGDGEYKGSAQQNVWMIEQVRQRFAAGRLD